MKLFTIGFTKTSAERFFTRLKVAGVRRLVDVRLHNVSQLAGFAKRDDLRYFLNVICGMEYVHRPELAPTEELLSDYKQHRSGWDVYAQNFMALLESRRVEMEMDPSALDQACLLCSEDRPHHCHRRLVAEYLKERWRNVEIVHL